MIGIGDCFYWLWVVVLILNSCICWKTQILILCVHTIIGSSKLKVRWWIMFWYKIRHHEDFMLHNCWLCSGTCSLEFRYGFLWYVTISWIINAAVIVDWILLKSRIVSLNLLRYANLNENCLDYHHHTQYILPIDGSGYGRVETFWI